MELREAARKINELLDAADAKQRLGGNAQPEVIESACLAKALIRAPGYMATHIRGPKEWRKALARMHPFLSGLGDFNELHKLIAQWEEEHA